MKFEILSLLAWVSICTQYWEYGLYIDSASFLFEACMCIFQPVIFIGGSSEGVKCYMSFEWNLMPAAIKEKKSEVIRTRHDDNFCWVVDINSRYFDPYFSVRELQKTKNIMKVFCYCWAFALFVHLVWFEYIYLLGCVLSWVIRHREMHFDVQAPFNTLSFRILGNDDALAYFNFVQVDNNNIDITLRQSVLNSNQDQYLVSMWPSCIQSKSLAFLVCECVCVCVCVSWAEFQCKGVLVCFSWLFFIRQIKTQ